MIKLKCKTCRNFEKETVIQYSKCYQAAEVFWCDESKLDMYLQETPQIYESQIIEIKGPANIDINKKISAVYLSPNSYYNGIETVNDIDSIRFCVCKITNVISQTEFKVLLQVQILEMCDIFAGRTQSFSENEAFCSRTEEPDSQYINTLDLGRFIVEDINYQGDVGVTYIIDKAENEVLAVNNWDFHANDWYLCQTRNSD